MNILYIRKKLLPPHSTLFMFSHQTKNKQNAGFTLVEVMVVILIITMLLILGNYSDFSLRREKARLEELTVQLISMIDQEKTNSLLGKTESSAIIRKRKITIDYADPDITYNSFADLAEDTENSYCGTPWNDTLCPWWWWWTNIPLTTKIWDLNGLSMSLYNCDDNTLSLVLATEVSVIFQGDTLAFDTVWLETIKHLVIFLSRNNLYRELHIDRRTGVTYERESIIANVNNPEPSCN